MKLSFLFIFLLILPFCFASPKLEIFNDNPNYLETIVAEISTDGVFYEDISIDDIKLFDGRREINVESKLYNNNGTYYVYFNFLSAGTYNIVIKELLYKVGNNILSGNINESITLSNNNDNVLSINPGIVFSENPKTLLTNNGKNKISVRYDSLSFDLVPGESKYIEFSKNLSFELVQINSYKTFKIPVIYIKPITSTKPSEVVKSFSVRPQESSITLNSYENENKYATFSFLNFNNNNISKFKISNSLSFVRLEVVGENINPKGNINMSINYGHDTEGMFVDNVSISYYENGIFYNYTIPLYFIVYPSVVSDPSTGYSFFQSKTCKELGGELCLGTCANGGTSYKTIDEGTTYCCVGGTCVQDIDIGGKNEEKSSGWIWGLIILIILGFVGYKIFDKYKKFGKKN